jgi:NADH:ubiquinone oxidoreductase subunit C
MDDRLLTLNEKTKARFGDQLIEVVQWRGELTFRMSSEHLVEILNWLKGESEPRFPMLVDISGVDGLKLDWEPRFRVSYHLLDPTSGLRVRVQADTTLDEGKPSLPTVTGLWESADWNEREVWDLMGISFAGHPNLKRILLHEDYEFGHPLQKQIPTRGLNDDNR